MTNTAEIRGRIALEGELTIYGAAALKSRLLSALNRYEVLEIDLSAVDEIDTAGLQVVALAKREAGNRGKTLLLVEHSQAVLDVLELTGLGSAFGDPVLIRPAAA